MLRLPQLLPQQLSRLPRAWQHSQWVGLLELEAQWEWLADALILAVVVKSLWLRMVAEGGAWEDACTGKWAGP